MNKEELEWPPGPVVQRPSVHAKPRELTVPVMATMRMEPLRLRKKR
jgi:hypothetical protein